MRTSVAALALVLAAGMAQAEERIVSIGGSLTEIIYALGEGDRLVARDTTSSYPEEAVELPDIGYMRALSPEGVLSVNPTLIVSEEGSGPPEAVMLLKQSGVPFVEVKDDFSRKGVSAKIRAIGAALSDEADAEALALAIDAKLAQAEARAAAQAGESPRRVLFILSTQGGRIMAAGTDTSADAIIRMAGGENVMTSFKGYKPVTDEAIGAAAPEVVLMMARSEEMEGNHGGAADELFAMPALSSTPAAADRALVKMPGLLLLGFGPRTAEAVTQLSRALYGE